MYNFPKAEMSQNGFSAELTQAQKDFAYNLGRIDGANGVKGKEASLAKSVKKSSAKSTDKKGRVEYNGDEKNLTDRQRVSLKALKTVSESLGINIHLYESVLDENGKRVYTDSDGKKITANGWYDTRTGDIYIDINSGLNGEGVMLFTAAHELTHFIRQWSPAKFKVLADFLMGEYGKAGASVSGLVHAQMAKAKKQGRTLSYDAAYEEMIADSMTTMLSDGKVVEKLAKLAKKDKSLVEKIKEFIDKLVQDIKKAYAGIKPDTKEGQFVQEMIGSAEKLQELFYDALVSAGENYTGSERILNTADGTKYMARDFSEQVDEVLTGNFDRTNAVYVGETPQILQDVGLNGKLPMLTTARHLRNANKPKNSSKHQHGLTEMQLKSIPKKIKDPVMIMDSLNTNSNSVVVVTDMLDSDGAPVIITIMADEKGMYNSVEVDTNFVTSY